MCGRYVSTAPPDEIARYFDAQELTEAPIEPSWNVAPTDETYVVLDHDGVRRVAVHRWGLVPSWAKDPSIAARMINARSEGTERRGSFKHALRHRRCIVPADGFYEWEKLGPKAKQPWFVHRADREPLAFAGLWEEWRGHGEDRPAEPLRTATIITTEANATMAPIHDRMPVVLPRSAWDRWLDPEVTSVDDLAGLLVPAPARLLVLRAVGAAVGNVRNEGPELVAPVAPDPASAVTDAEPLPDPGEDPAPDAASS